MTALDDAASASLRGQQAFWRYDRYGNRLSQTTTALGSNAAPSIDPTTNRAALYNFDVAGNMLSDGSYSYTYDDEGRQTSNSSGSTYAYDASGRIASATNNGKVQVFAYGLQDRRIAVLDASAGVTTSYQVYAGGQEMAFETGGQITYQYQNQVSSEGARLKNGVLTTFSSLPYGDGQTSTGGADEDTAHFAGLDTLAQSPNTLHAGYRDYHFNSGRWMSPDPYDGSYDGTDPQSLNRYTYTFNNPLIYLDPLGLDGWGGDGCYHFDGALTQTQNPDGTYTDSTPADGICPGPYLGGLATGVGGNVGYSNYGLGGGGWSGFSSGPTSPSGKTNPTQCSVLSPDPNQNCANNKIKRAAIRFICKDSQASKVGASMRTGMFFGAGFGAFAGAGAAGVGAVPGAILGGLEGAAAGAISGFLRANVIAAACQNIGAYD